MAQSISILDTIKGQYNLKDIKPGEYSPLSLAFIGDSVFDLVVKTVIVQRGNCQANKLHNRTSRVVKADSQAKMIDYFKQQELLSEEEEKIYRRGHNAKSNTKAKNASYAFYSKATGLECLIGYLYLMGRIERVVELIQIGMNYIEDNNLAGIRNTSAH